MKPELEKIDLKGYQQSFHFYRTEVDAFTPFWHYHPELELTLITKGKGTRFVGDSIEPFTDLDLVLVGKNVPHHWVSLKQNNSTKQKAIVFQFNTGIFEKFKECGHFGTFFSLAGRGIHFSNPSEYILKRILNFENLDNLERLSELLLLLNALSKDNQKRVLASENYNAVQKRQATEQKFSKVNNFILEHLNQKLTVNEMADMTNMVPQSFCRWFKKHSGHSFISFLNLSRIERACQLLLTSSSSIQHIAYDCGFETLSHFNRTFKGIKRVSPRTFRKTALI